MNEAFQTGFVKQGSLLDYVRAIKHNDSHVLEKNEKSYIQTRIIQGIIQRRKTYKERLESHKEVSSDPSIRDSQNQYKFANHLDEQEDINLIKKVVKPSTMKHMNKEAFERGFLKAALANGVEPLLAIRLMKQSIARNDQFTHYQGMKRKQYGHEKDWNHESYCGHCGSAIGEYHEIGCEQEEHPKTHEQLGDGTITRYINKTANLQQ